MQSLFSAIRTFLENRPGQPLGLGLGLSLALAACGSSDDTSETDTSVPLTTEQLEESRVAANDAYKTANEAYLTANAEKDGWTTTEEGLQYFVETAGPDGAKAPQIGDFVKVNYELKLIDDRIIDSSYQRGEPAIFPLTERLIAGWRVGIPLMREGATFNFVVPSELGYGANALPELPAYSTLFFKVDLLNVLTAEEGQAALAEQQQRMIEAMKAEQQAYLDENAQKEGVQVTESGLQIEILESGAEDGPLPGPNTDVEVHYRGALIDGSEFDSSYRRGQTATFKPTQVIGGWTEALQMMRPGDKWKLTIPHELGYGPNGSGRNIPPFATLVFEVELVSLKGE